MYTPASEDRGEGGCADAGQASCGRGLPGACEQRYGADTLHKTRLPEDLSTIFEGSRLAGHSDVEMPQFTFAPDRIDDLLAYILLAYIRSIPFPDSPDGAR